MLPFDLSLSLPDHRQWGEPGTGRLWSDKILWLEKSDHFPIGRGLIWNCETTYIAFFLSPCTEKSTHWQWYTFNKCN